MLYDCAGGYYCPASEWHQSGEVFERMKLAARFLEDVQSTDGNIDLMSTNFNSPPDTAFVVHKVATAARLADVHNDKAMLDVLRSFLERAGGGITRGGIHTPNHRWVVCAALAQLYELFSHESYLTRIDEWLAEGIDIDEEGQYIERSTAIYNAAINHAFIVMAVKLNRPELLAPVRANLDAMRYLIHPNGEVVTEISRRQDVGQRRDMGNYWFALRYMANLDGNGQYAAMLAPIEPHRMELSTLLEYPEMQAVSPAQTPLPDPFEREYPLSEIIRIRQQRLSATIMGARKGNRLVSHFGEAVVEGVRVAVDFSRRGLFIPAETERRADGWLFRQELSSEGKTLTIEMLIRRTSGGFALELRSFGEAHVPVLVEVALRSGGELTGGVPSADAGGAHFLREGYAQYRVGDDVLRIGPGNAAHEQILMPGADGPAPLGVYVTGHTLFDHTLFLEMT
ncbi:MAG TPA: hypothetical protein ENN29_01100 [Candidatus Hydrogenedentes bacterium]|nr:hypothetical protein [Candidatus Hydrogenedentota bacterium]